MNHRARPASGPIGIDAVAIAVPEAYLELRDLAAARGVEAAKYTEGLLVEAMGVAAAHEDTVALAARAAQRVLQQANVDVADIGLCIVGTETAVDHSKPVAAWLHRLLGLSTSCRSFETKHACFGGTAGVLAAVDWVSSGAARGRSALVVCSDIARYTVGGPGEPTQGAGAVALIIKEAPRLLALEVGLSGSYTKDVDDFWRPLWSKDALVDGHVSVDCYLDALAGAYGAWRAAVDDVGLHEDTDDNAIVRRCFHVPYGKMAKKAHAKLCDLRGLSDDDAARSYALEVLPSLRLPRVVGNIYTGSLWLALASLLETDAAAIEGRRISLFSYGSGCTAEFFCGRVVDGAGAFVQQLQLSAPLHNRRRLSVAAYEQVRADDARLDVADLVIDAPTAAPSLRGIANGRRRYG
jgi:hydroxymethylglutaryl-CoA synthase